MITKKISNKLEKELLRSIYKKYIERYGHGVRRISEFRVLITAGDIYHRDIPELLEKTDNGTKSRFLDVLRELEAIGYVRSDGAGAYVLTEPGYTEAAMSRIDKFLDFFNRNQGLAIPISMVSLIISLIALFVSS
ncbi:hypothetical protein NPS34_25670 [Pseudomonas putida]|uniref:hypothetical protein n=1 Tax=Pseudomonas putida TaxID=303 RepID=UPI0012D32C61|nr:hypothetical protein [Pseudomonas putida]MDD2001423.1 hypothetical protein [Pseudomonas putida]HDS1791474.1 hypothetical protein [Pseudomonas putida]